MGYRGAVRVDHRTLPGAPVPVLASAREACTSPRVRASLRPSPVLLRESREKPGPPTAPSTLFPSVDSEKVCQAKPAKLRRPEVTEFWGHCVPVCSVERVPRSRAEAEALEPAHLAVNTRAVPQRPVSLCSRGRGRGSAGSAAPLRPWLFSAIVARSQQFTELPPSSCHPRFQTRAICVTPILNLRQTCIAWL